MHAATAGAGGLAARPSRSRNAQSEPLGAVLLLFFYDVLK
jgi:hypothetical protein